MAETQTDVLDNKEEAIGEDNKNSKVQKKELNLCFNHFYFWYPAHTNWYNGYILLLKHIIMIFLSLKIKNSGPSFFFKMYYHVHVQNVHINLT